MSAIFNEYTVALEQEPSSDVPVEPDLVAALLHAARSEDVTRLKQHSAGYITHVWAEFPSEAAALAFRDVAALRCAEAGVNSRTVIRPGDHIRHAHPRAAGRFYVTVILDSTPEESR